MKNGLRSALIGLLLTATSISPLLLPATATAAVITYAQPYIAGFTPTSGPVGTVITVNGKGFTGANVAFIGAAHNVTVRIVSDAQLQMTVPTNATTGQIAILNPKSAAFSPQAYTLTVATAPAPAPAPTPAPTPTPTPAPAPTPTPAPAPAPAPTPGVGMGPTRAARLLTQATFGPTFTSLNSTSAQTYDAWFAAQASAPPSLTLTNVPNKDVNWVPFWWRNVVNGPDQLRQRMAFALSEILVVSDQSAGTINQSQAAAAYYDILVNNSLGNYRTLLEKVTLSPAMGLYLNMFRNDKSNPTTGVHADQNYAREIMQLFTVGLVKLNLDGSVQKDNSGNPLPTYTQKEVEQMANTLTGWASKPTQNTGEGAWQYDVDYINPMVAYANHHDTTAKTLIGGAVVPAGGTAAQDLKIALDTLFNHPNVGPFLSSQLIKRLVTSNPSPAYIQRVASVFNNNGSGVRGDLLAVAKAILTDPEATTVSASGTAGKLREPLLRLAHLWRAFNASDANGNLSEFSVLQNSPTAFAESPLSAPTVFNFFQPDYVRAGTLATAGMVAPEFQITNENTLVLTNNQLQRQAYQFIDSTGKKYYSPNGYSEVGSLNANSVLLKTKDWEAYASKPDILVNKLNAVLLGGQMTSAMRNSLINYAASIPSTDSVSRITETADLILNSPQYAVQH